MADQETPLHAFLGSAGQLVKERSWISLLLILLVCPIIFFYLSHALYCIFLHPLAKFPGPKLAAVSQIPIAARVWNGTLHTWLRHIHESYDSDVVRISPHELSFISYSAWKDIYSTRNGHPGFPKDQVGFGGKDSILTANNADHSRMRRLLSHAFSEKALREQETLLQFHVKKLIDGIQKHLQETQNGEINMVDWCHWVSFDIIGDLAFGEPFYCLDHAKYNPWIAKLIQGFKTLASFSVILRFKLLAKVLRIYLSRSKMVKDSFDHWRLAKEKVQRRMQQGCARPDFMSCILQNNTDKAGLTQAEINRNASLFINAGSQSTATFLSGALWFIVQNPQCAAKMRDEIQELKTAEGAISVRNLGQLKYFNAFVHECHRMYPGTLTGLPRSSTAVGDTAGIYMIPKHTGVICNQYAAYRSSRNFKDPNTFTPERWLGDDRYESDQRQILQPFAMGPRNCIGKNLANAEIGLILTHLLLAFDFEVCKSTDTAWTDQKAWFGWDKKPLVVRVIVR